MNMTARQVVAPAARTVTGNTGTLTEDTKRYVQLRASLNVTAASGTTPTLDVLIQDTLDDGLTWNTIATFTQATGVTNEVKDVTLPFGTKLRVLWTIGGTTPSFTFHVDWVKK